MERRLFIKKAGLVSASLAILPTYSFGQEFDYSIQELMGKVEMPTFENGVSLREEAYSAFLKMKQAAYSSGIDLKVVSSFRSFQSQQRIFERKYIKYTDEQNLSPFKAIDKIIEYSTIPGTSRHHWGTDIDLIDGYRAIDGDVLVPEKFEEGGPYNDFLTWMTENSNSFGYHLVYTKSAKRRGFKYEPWHYSYAPISKPMLECFRGENIVQLLQKEQFEGSSHFTIGFLKNYIQNNVLDINPALI